MDLNTLHTEDWGQFIEANDIDLSCPHCSGQGETDEKATCDACGGSGYIEPLWDTVWDTGFSAGDDFARRPYGNVFAFAHEGNIWLGLTACGMDCKPYLAAAWVSLFPDCQWVPDNFAVAGCDLAGGYLSACLPSPMVRQILRRMEYGARADIRNRRRIIGEVKAARKALAAAEKAAKAGKGAK